MRREFITEVVLPCIRAGRRKERQAESEECSRHGCRSREGAMGQQCKQVSGCTWLFKAQKSFN